MRVLVIEDDEELAATVATGLRQARMAVDVAFDGQAGLTRALVSDYDVIVLDRDLPAIHGDEVCAKLVAAAGSCPAPHDEQRRVNAVPHSLQNFEPSWLSA